MEHVTGIGGVFFKSEDPEKLKDWYVKHLGFPTDSGGYVVFSWREPGTTTWNPFPSNTSYFGPGSAPFMVNFRVRDLDAMLEQLRGAGVTVDPRVETMEFGKFGWAQDPEGNRIELWEPAPGM